jgi:hypothetical protein
MRGVGKVNAKEAQFVMNAFVKFDYSHIEVLIVGT